MTINDLLKQLELSITSNKNITLNINKDKVDNRKSLHRKSVNNHDDYEERVDKFYTNYYRGTSF